MAANTAEQQEDIKAWEAEELGPCPHTLDFPQQEQKKLSPQGTWHKMAIIKCCKTKDGEREEKKGERKKKVIEVQIIKKSNKCKWELWQIYILL